MNTDKNSITLFVKVIENGSFSRAALREGIPVSTVSRKIAALEKELKVRLIERSTRKLRLTEIGQDYFEHCRRGLAEFEAADSLITHRKIDISGRLRISVPPSMSDIVMVPLVSAFQALHPKVVVHCHITERFVDHIGDGIDLSLRIGDLRDSSLIASTVTTSRPKLIVSPKYQIKREELSHPIEILPHVKIAFSRWEKPIHWVLNSKEETAHINPEPSFVLNDYAGVLQGVIDGLGISEVPGFICERELNAGRLIEILPEWRFAGIKVAAVYPSNKNLSPLVRSFKEFCIKYFENNPLSSSN